MRVLATAVLLAGLFVGAPAAQASGWWQPRGSLTWQIQFDGRIDKTVNAQVFDVDAFEASARLVQSFHAQGQRVICYINAGAWENWRPDAGSYPSVVKGKPLTGWPGERWLDIRRIDILGPILTDRVAICAAKGFDGVEFDNVDGESNDTGFALTPHDQLVFDRWLADAAHAAGLAVGLKNTLSLVAQLEPKFDFAILEQCFQYRECTLVKPFLADNKPVLDIEYRLSRPDFCTKAAALGLFAMRKRLALDAWRRACAG